MFYKHSKLFQDPKIDYPIYDLELPFTDYIQKTKHIIANTRQDLDQRAQWIIEANSPFELRPTTQPTYGVLLIHGLLDSPFIMRDIGEQLRKQGCLVRSILLPGHGTVPGALLNTHYKEWIQAVHYGVTTLKSEVKKIFLAGYSTGANLSIYHAATDNTIMGSILLSPAFRINSPFTFLVNWHRAISWPWERAKWFYISKEFDYVKYCSVPLNAIYQVDCLAQEIKKINHEKLTHCPLFIALSYEDKVVCSKASLDYFQKNKHPISQMFLYSNKNLHYSDPRISVHSSVYPDLGITSFSHISLPNARSNMHYGENGDYPLASKIDQNKFIYGAQDKFDTWMYSILYRLHLIKLQHHRLTFNPDFDFLIQEIEKFIQESTVAT